MKKKIIHGVEVFLDDDGRWKDITGSVYGFAEDELSADREVRLGVGFLSLPKSHPFTPCARAHDFCYSSPEFMRNNPRSRADGEFLDAMLSVAAGDFTLTAQAYALYAVTRTAGWYWWECKATRWV